MELAKQISELNEILQNPSSEISEETIEKLKTERLNLTLDFLENSDSDFVTIWNKNIELLASEKLLFKVSPQNSKPFSAYSETYYGNIDNEFRLELKRKEIGFIPLPIGRHIFPTELKGIIDGIGRIELKVTSSNFNFTGLKVPESYSANLENSGAIKLKINKTSISIPRSAKIWKLSCNLLKIAPKDKHQFLANREIIFDKVRTVWQTLDSNSV